LSAPDPAALEIAAGGERFVARTRLAFFGTIWLIPATLIFSDERPEIRVAFVAASIAAAVSGAFLLATRRRAMRGLPFLTSAFDVSIVTATLAAFALIGRPDVAVTSMVTWEIYLLAITTTVLRFDLRVSLFAGALAFLEYTLLLAWVTSRWDVPQLSWSIEVGRLFLIVAATVLAVGIVLRSRPMMHLSTTDKLTGLPNRAYFLERLSVELERAKRFGHPLALAMLDIDHFKQFNDRFGHAAGDAALRTFAIELRAQTRASDLIARWGGEELIVAFPETETGGAELQLARLRSELQRTRMPNLDRSIRLTFSGGVAHFPDHAIDAATLIAAADGRLLTAKRLGRDRVVGQQERDEVSNSA
jgi:diguanylate cyclase (GGDEF)-like protein